MASKNPMPHQIRLRVNDEMKAHLDAKKEKYNYSHTDQIRDLIKKDMQR